MSKNKSNLKNRAKERADFAFKAVQTATTTSSQKQEKYKTSIKQLPGYIKANGLLAALSFAFQKEEKHAGWEQLNKDLKDWLGKHCKHLGDIGNANRHLIESLLLTDTMTQRAITYEILDLLIWMKRFSEGLMADIKEEN